MTGQNVRVSSSFELDGFQKKVKTDATPHQSSGQAHSQSAQHAAQKSDSKSKKADGAFKTISEVADILKVQQHVLRFWETKFTQVKPLKRGGGRRYYRPEDVALLKHIHHLLYTEGYTIKGVQKLLKGQGKQQIVARAENENAGTHFQAPPKVKSSEPVQAQPEPAAPAQKQPQKASMSDTERAVLEVMLEELKALRGMIKA